MGYHSGGCAKQYSMHEFLGMWTETTRGGNGRKKGNSSVESLGK